MDLSSLSKAGELNPWSDADSALSPLLNILSLVEKLGYIEKVCYITTRMKSKSYLQIDDINFF